MSTTNKCGRNYKYLRAYISLWDREVLVDTLDDFPIVEKIKINRGFGKKHT